MTRLMVNGPSLDVLAGYPVHRVEVLTEWTNPAGCVFTDWRASCGATGTASGTSRGFTRGIERTLRPERCTKCWSRT